MKPLLRNSLFTLFVAFLSLLVFGHGKNAFGWIGGYIGYSIAFFTLGLLYSYSNLSHLIHLVVVVGVLFFNFYNLYTSGAEHIYFPTPAIVLALGAIVSYVAGRVWSFNLKPLSIGLITCVLAVNIAFCNWMPSYFYDHLTNLTMFNKALNKKVVLNFTDLDGNSISEDVWRDKILVIDFWYIECGMCREKLLLLDKVSKYYKNNKNVQIISVIDGSLNTKEEVKKYLGTTELPFPFLYDPDGEFVKKYGLGIEGYPVEIKIDKSGHIKEVLLGLWDFKSVYVDKTIESITLLL